ncbi:MAG: hypothetical protein NVSMB26_20110 [Beijerinckiaceae bacterium]
MEVEQAAFSAPAESPTSVAGEEARTRSARRRRKKAEANATPAAAPSIDAGMPAIDAAPKVQSNSPTLAINPNAVRSEGTNKPHAISLVRPADRKPNATQAGFFKRHRALAAGMAIAVALGGFVGTQIGVERAGETAAAATSVNIAAALPWKRDVAMASTQTRELARLKEELRGVRAQLDTLRANTDPVRQGQEIKALRASLETLKEGLNATRIDTANAIAQVSSAHVSAKGTEQDTQRIEKIADRLDRLERQMADPAPVAAIAPKSEATKPAAGPDTHALPTPADVAAAQMKNEPKPKMVHNYILREVADGVALIEGPDGLREVWPGRTIPGAGKVTSIEKQGGKWVVVTSEGVIAFKRDAYSDAR